MNPMTKVSLSGSRRKLLEIMQEANFARIEGLRVRDGEPVLNPMPRVIREVKFGGENGPRPERVPSDRRDAVHDRKEANQRRHLTRQKLVRHTLRPVQQPAEVVDETVDALVGHPLALVAAPAQDEGAVLSLRLLEETLDQRRLADAGRPVEEHRDTLPVADLDERSSQLVKLPLPANERLVTGKVCRSSRGGLAAAENGLDLLGPGSGLGDSSDERHAEIRQVSRRPGHQSRGRDGRV